VHLETVDGGTYNVGVPARDVPTRKPKYGLSRSDEVPGDLRAVVRADEAHADGSVVSVGCGLEVGAFGVQCWRGRVKALGFLQGPGVAEVRLGRGQGLRDLREERIK
jgi:hypothetical protein